MNSNSVWSDAYYIQETLSQRLAAYCLGLDTGITLGQWTRNEVQPDQAMIFKITQLAILVKSMSIEGSDTIQSWFLGIKRSLNNECPATFLRKDFNKNSTLR